MRKAIVIAALAAALCLLGGCDFFRVLAGRPTSREIVAKRVRIGQELASNRRQSDDREQPQQPVDSLSAEDTLRQEDAARPQTGPQAAPQPAPAPVQEVREEAAPAAAPRETPSGKTVSVRTLSAVDPGVLTHHYYLMIGAFGQQENAEKQAMRAEKAGYPALLIPFKNGVTAVGVCPTDDLNAAWAMLDKLRKESFCPADAWILNNE